MAKRFGSVTILALAVAVIFSGLSAETEGDREDRPPRALRVGKPPGGYHEDSPGDRPPGGRRPAMHRAPGAATQPHRRDLSKAQEQELLGVLKEKRPEHHKRLMKLRESSRMRYRWMLQMMWRWYQRWKHLPEEIQAAAITEMDSKVQVWRLARELRKEISKDERKELLFKLREAVARQFDAEQKVRTHRLAQLEKQLQRARLELRERSEKRSQTIDDLVKRLLKPPPALKPHSGRDAPASQALQRDKRQPPQPK